MASINDYVDSINLSIDTLHNNTATLKDVRPEDLPSNFKLMMMASEKGDSRLLQFIFDNKLDLVIDSLLNKLMIGDYSEIERYSGTIKKVFEMFGVGEGAFEGPVAQALMRSITNSLDSYKLNTTKNKIKRCMIIINNLKKDANSLKDPAIKKKYFEAVHALKQTLKFISKVYKDRRIITNRVKAGLKYAVNESYQLDEDLLDFDFDLTKED